jgi:hypothetical protein
MLLTSETQMQKFLARFISFQIQTIVVGIIATSANEISILMNNLPVHQLSDSGIVSDILLIKMKVSAPESEFRSGNSTALQIATWRSSARLERQVFTLTDEIVNSPAELTAFQSTGSNFSELTLKLLCCVFLNYSQFVLQWSLLSWFLGTFH